MSDATTRQNERPLALKEATHSDRPHTANNSTRNKARNDPTMMPMSTTLSGMAASIRAATDNETFDLAGHDVSPDFISLHPSFLNRVLSDDDDDPHSLGFQHPQHNQ